MPNLKFLASTVPEIFAGSENSKSGLRDPHMTPFDLILQILDIFPVFNMSVKFDANGFIDDRYMATLRLRRCGCEMPIWANYGSF